MGCVDIYGAWSTAPWAHAAVNFLCSVQGQSFRYVLSYYERIAVFPASGVAEAQLALTLASEHNRGSAVCTLWHCAFLIHSCSDETPYSANPRKASLFGRRARSKMEGECSREPHLREKSGSPLAFAGPCSHPARRIFPRLPASGGYRRNTWGSAKCSCSWFGIWRLGFRRVRRACGVTRR